MKRMGNEELLNCNGGGLFATIVNIVVGIFSITKAILSWKNLRG